ncbi:unnamed protein product [Effrenium voratum]|nr:unnamed protein product [Effrenium voratum]
MAQPSSPEAPRHPSSQADLLEFPRRRLVQRPTVTANLSSTLDLGAASPARRVIREAAHVLTKDHQSDFGYPQPSPRHAHPGNSPSYQTEVTRRSGCTLTSPRKQRSFEEELQEASAWTPSTATPSQSNPASAWSPIRFGSPSPRPIAVSSPGSPVRRRMAELDLLIAEAESQVQSLELWWRSIRTPEDKELPSHRINLEKLVQSAVAALQPAVGRARALEQRRCERRSPSAAPAWRSWI